MWKTTRSYDGWHSFRASKLRVQKGRQEDHDADTPNPEAAGTFEMQVSKNDDSFKDRDCEGPDTPRKCGGTLPILATSTEQVHDPRPLGPA